MRNLFTILLLAIAFTWIKAQSFEQQVKDIAERIDSITTTKRAALKTAVEAVDRRLENGEITSLEAKLEREQLADYHAERIESQVNAEREKLDNLVANRVENNIDPATQDTLKKNSVKIKIEFNNDEKKEKRTTSQVVFALGLNMLTGDEGGLGDHMKGWQSKFTELGVTWNTRISENSNLFHIKYGGSLVWNAFSPEDNLIVTPQGDQTILVPSDIDFKRNKFRNLYANFPVHFELDFSPMKYNEAGERIFRSHEGFRIGLGGFAGVLMNSKNKFKYNEDGKKVKFSVKDNYNVNNFTYGLSAYAGYKQFSLYTKYDLQPVFENNAVDENNFSIGLRWDIN